MSDQEIIMDTMDFAADNRTDNDKRSQKTVNVIVRRLSYEEIESVYDMYMVKHFPMEKLKPITVIKYMHDRGKYSAVGLFNKKHNDVDNIYAYAFFAMNSGREMVLLDYIALAERFRGIRMGSLFMKILLNMFPKSKGIIIESMLPEGVSSGYSKEHAAYFDRFLLYNGAVFTGIRTKIYGIRYNIWLLPVKKHMDMSEVRIQLSGIYREMYSETDNGSFDSLNERYRRLMN